MHKKIAVLPGDGIGPEVMDQALRVIAQIADLYGHYFEIAKGLIGGAAYDQFESHFPEETKKICDSSDAILFGSVGGPVDELNKDKWKGCEAKSLLALRKTYSFNANLRPVKVYPSLKHLCPLKLKSDIDILFVRELLGDLYFGKHVTYKNDSGKREALDECIYDEDQIRSVAEVAFKSAGLRGNKVTSVDKANVLDTSKLWREVVLEVSEEYPNVELEHMLVDNCAMQLIIDPAQFDVILTGNMFGDILSDAAAVLPGSLGLLPSASMNNQGFGYYEPSGGSAQDIVGKGVANPVAQILSAALMLRHSFGLEAESAAIENAVKMVLDAGKATADIASDPVSTIQFTDYVIESLPRVASS